MSQTTPTGPRHALSREPEPPTTAIPVPTPVPVPNEFTDDATQLLPVIPVQRTAPPARIDGPRPPIGRPSAQQPPAGVFPVAAVPPKPRRRVLPAVLAVVTACLLAAGIAVGVTGATSADLTVQPPSATGTP